MSGGGLALLVSMTVANALNFVFQLVAARRLGPESYGELGALTGVLFIFSVPSAALQSVITAQVAGRLRDSEGKPVPLIVGPLLGSAVAWGVVTSVVLIALAPLVTDFLHLSSITAAFLLAVYVLPTMIDLVPRAVLLGELRFVRVASALIVGSIVRLAVLFAVTPSRGVSGAMAANVAGALATAAVLLFYVRPFIGHKNDGHSVTVGWKMASAAIAAFTGYWALNGIDVVLGRHYLGHFESGIYSAAATTASVALFVSGAFVTAAFPRFAAGRGVGPAVRALLIQTLALASALGGSVALAMAIAPGLVAETMFGSSYASTGHALGVLAFAAVCTSLLMILLQFHLSGRFTGAASLAWLGVAVVAAASFFFHESPLNFAVIKLCAVAIAVAVMMLLAFARRQPEPTDASFLEGTLKASKPDLDLSMIVPYYNPGPALRRNIENIIDVLSSTNLSYEIIAVSDGATDGSEKTLEGLDSGLVRSVVLPVNTGKGQALRVGFANGRGRYLGFIDADGDVNPSLLEPYLAIVDLYEPDIILGSKRHPMSQVHYPPLRYLYSWGYQLLIRILFNLKVRDTQTGLKLIKRDVLEEVLPRMVEKRFAFDLELFVVAKHLGHDQFFEAPIRIEQRFTSTISRSTWIGTLLDTLAVFYRLHLLHYYDKPRHRIDPEVTLEERVRGTQL